MIFFFRNWIGSLVFKVADATKHKVVFSISLFFTSDVILFSGLAGP